MSEIDRSAYVGATRAGVYSMSAHGASGRGVRVTSMSRRSVLAGLGGATGAVALGAFAPPASAQANGGGGFGPSSAAAAAPLAPAALTPGLAYLPVDPSAFEPISSGQGRALNAATGTSILTPPGGLVAAVIVPIGAVLKEITFAYFSPAGALTVALWKKALTTGWALVAPHPPTGLDLANGPSIQTVTFELTEPVDGTSTYMMLLNSISTTTQSVHGMLVGYAPPATPPPPAFVPISPINRVLDTRTTGGKLRPDEERVIDLHVPGFASAAVINLTVTATEVAGFVAVFPANVAYPGNSSINWSAPDQNIANGVVTGTDRSGHVKIRGGVNATDVVIDVQGYLA
jgi:hypothetical protein